MSRRESVERIELLPDGKLLLFDNGFNRNFRGLENGYSRAVAYEIDEASREVRQAWQYGADRGVDWFSSIISDVDSLAGTRRWLIATGAVRQSDTGPHAYVTEVDTATGQVVFEARIAFKDAYVDPKGAPWGNIDIVYRAERMSLYPGLVGERIKPRD